jgi:hypothetical protein
MTQTHAYVRAVLKVMSKLISKSNKGMNRETPTSSQICALPHKIPFQINTLLPPFSIFKIPVNNCPTRCICTCMSADTGSSDSSMSADSSKNGLTSARCCNYNLNVLLMMDEGII